MRIEYEADTDFLRIRIQGELVIAHVSDAREQLIQRKVNQDQVLVDLSEVEDLDTAGVQLLIALKKHSQAAGYRLRFTNHSPVVLEYFALYGLVGYFGDRIALKKGEKERYGFLYGLKRESQSA